MQEPENDHLWSYLGETYLRLGEYDLAREALDRYLVLKPDDPFGVHDPRAACATD